MRVLRVLASENSTVARSTALNQRTAECNTLGLRKNAETERRRAAPQMKGVAALRSEVETEGGVDVKVA
jgi:hypothetical protein